MSLVDPSWSLPVYALSYGLIGIAAGMLSGLLGLGGGVVIVPALTYLFEIQGISPDATLRLALGTSLGTIALTSLSSANAHHRHGAVDWGIVRRTAPGIVVGTYVGGMLAARMVTSTLKTVFAVFLAAVAVQVLTGARPRPTRTMPGHAGCAGAGVVIGGVSGLVGVGGGSMSVPFMIWCNVGARRAVGTSAAIGLPIAVVGALSYLVNGWGAPMGIRYSVGYLHLPALCGIALTSVLTAPLGARLASKLDPAGLKRAFGCLLLVMSLKMLWSALLS